jgi:hypothetical protein
MSCAVILAVSSMASNRVSQQSATMLLITAATMLAVRNLTQSRIGRAFYAIHISEIAAGSIGIPAGATIVSLTANTIIISAAATASATVTATVTALAPSQFNFNGGIIQAGLDLTGANAIPNPVFFNGDYATVTGTNSLTFSGAVTNYNGNRYLNNVLTGGAVLNLTNTVNLSHDGSGRILVLIGSGTTNISGVLKDSSSTGTGSSVYLRGATSAQLNLTATNITDRASPHAPSSTGPPRWPRSTLPASRPRSRHGSRVASDRDNRRHEPKPASGSEIPDRSNRRQRF